MAKPDNPILINMSVPPQEAAEAAYTNLPLTLVNDHVIRISVMTEDFYWHYHPNSDETFQVLEGTLLIDLEGGTIELVPGQLLTIPKNMPHRSRPKNGRSVNITFETADMQTIRIARS